MSTSKNSTEQKSPLATRQLEHYQSCEDCLELKTLCSKGKKIRPRGRPRIIQISENDTETDKKRKKMNRIVELARQRRARVRKEKKRIAKIKDILYEEYLKEVANKSRHPIEVEDSDDESEPEIVIHTDDSNSSD